MSNNTDTAACLPLECSASLVSHVQQFTGRGRQMLGPSGGLTECSQILQISAGLPALVLSQ